MNDDQIEPSLLDRALLALSEVAESATDIFSSTSSKVGEVGSQIGTELGNKIPENIDEQAGAIGASIGETAGAVGEKAGAIGGSIGTVLAENFEAAITFTKGLFGG